MAALDQHTALVVNRETIPLSDALKAALWGTGLAFLQDAVDASLVRQEARKRGFAATDDELQEAAEAFQDQRGLYDAESLEAWLAAHHLTLDDWEAYLEQGVLARKLGDALVADGQIEQHFAQNILSFETATVSQILVDDPDVAEELRAQIVEDGSDFYTLAREYSIDEATRPASGYVGSVGRARLDAAMSAAVFGAEPGSVVGPVQTERGWHIVKVETRHAAALDEATSERIRTLLFSEWLEEQRGKARLEIRVLDELAGAQSAG